MSHSVSFLSSLGVSFWGVKSRNCEGLCPEGKVSEKLCGFYPRKWHHWSVWGLSEGWSLWHSGNCVYQAVRPQNTYQLYASWCVVSEMYIQNKISEIFCIFPSRTWGIWTVCIVLFGVWSLWSVLESVSRIWGLWGICGSLSQGVRCLSCLNYYVPGYIT